MLTKFKKCILFLQCLSFLVLKRSFINVLHDIAQKYNNVTVIELRKLERLRVKFLKSSHDVCFLNNCRSFGVFPKFITFNLPNVSRKDVIGIRKKLLRSAIHQQNKRKNQSEKELTTHATNLRSKLSFVDWFILNKYIKEIVDKKIKKCVKIQEKKLKNLTKHTSLQCLNPNKTITNLTNYNLTQEETELLKNGLFFSIAPPFLKKSDVFTSFENIHRFLSKNLIDEANKPQLKAEISHMTHTYFSNYKPSRRILHQHNILTKLKNNKDLVICKPDKGNGVVILERSKYDEAIQKLIDDPEKFEQLNEDPTQKREESLQRFLRKLKKNGFFNDAEYSKIYPKGTNPARIYGLPKMHKFKETDSFPKFRPIVSSIGTFNYNLSKFLCNLLHPLTPTKHSSKDTFSFLTDLHKSNLSGKFFVSYDVSSLFTNIPLSETIELSVNLILDANPNLKINKKDLTKIFRFATSQSHFLFNGKFFNQIDGVAMGSPLAPVLANIFMGINEDKWIDNFDGNKPVFYRRYVDDILAVFDNEQDATKFFNHLNNQHKNIKFTMETNLNNQMPFLDTLITNINDNIITKTYHKPTYTGLLLNFTSFTPFSYKNNLTKCLIDRIFKINNTWTGFNSDIKTLTSTFQQNGYPKHLIEKNIKTYLDKFHANKDNDNINNNNNNPNDTNFFTLPYVGKFSDQTKIKLNNLIRRFCKNDIKIKLVFTSFKIKQYFTSKDKIPFDLQSMIVYKFICAGCGSSYIGETTRHIKTRIEEHIKRDKNSHIFKHLNSNPNCLDSLNKDCFQIIDRTSNSFNLKIKEALHISWDKPNLNAQVNHYNLAIST